MERWRARLAALEPPPAAGEDRTAEETAGSSGEQDGDLICAAEYEFVRQGEAHRTGAHALPFVRLESVCA